MKRPNYTEISFSAFDAETGIKNRGEDAIGRSKPSPHHPDNMIVWCGCTIPNRYSECRASNYDPTDWSDNEFKMEGNASPLLDCINAEVKVLVGHNIKFDLLYLMKNEPMREILYSWLRRGGIIWDTMVVEYLLTGQESQFINLDKLSVQYGGHVKDDRLKKEYWDKDIDTEMIPAQIIRPYLQGDLRNTAGNYMAQLDKIESLRGKQKENFYALIQVQMEALLATTMIEHNGIHFDVPAATEVTATLAARNEIKSEELQATMAKWFNLSRNKYVDPEVLPEDCNPGSIQQLSAMLCGGVFKYTKKLPLLDDLGNTTKYKSGMKKGEIKERNEDLILHVGGMIEHKAHGLKKTDKGYQLDEASLKKVSALPFVKSEPAIGGFINEVITWRSLQKELKVSYMGLLELTWPTDSCIHGNINHTATATGRLSSSAPNQQNFSGKEVKE